MYQGADIRAQDLSSLKLYPFSVGFLRSLKNGIRIPKATEYQTFDWGRLYISFRA